MKLIPAFFLCLLIPPLYAQNNYVYDKKGQLISDLSQGITDISWNNLNKITKIVRADTSNQPDLEYFYNAQGHRITKLIKPRDGQGIKPEHTWIYTHYVYDLDGNLIATYQRNYTVESNGFGEHIMLGQFEIAGEERLGEIIVNNQLNTQQFQANLDTEGNFINISPIGLSVPAVTNQYKIDLGTKRYYLSNHLDNIHMIISDRKVLFQNENILETHAEWKAALDYYPYGMPMPGRNLFYESPAYAFNAAKLDNEITGFGNSYFFGERQYDPRLGRFLSMDPLYDEFPQWSPYIFAANNPIRYIDYEGKSPLDRFKSLEEAAADFAHFYGSLSILHDREFGATLYEVYLGNGKSYYTYSIPNRDGAHHVHVSEPSKSRTQVITKLGIIHSHGAYDQYENNDNFSSGDIKNADDKNIMTARQGIAWKSYLVTTDGRLLRYEPQKKHHKNKGITEVNRKAPSDAKNPKRKNKIDPVEHDYEKAPYIDVSNNNAPPKVAKTKVKSPAKASDDNWPEDTPEFLKWKPE